jgi:uncharacterized peroxidase-related enzyme
MVRFVPIDARQLNLEAQDGFAQLQVKSEEVSNFLQILAQAPAALKAYALADRALAQGQLSIREREQIALAIAEINGSSYCLAAHSTAGRQAGLTPLELQQARQAMALDPKLQAMLRLARTLVLQRGRVSDADFLSWRQAGLSQAEIIEVIANVALNIFTNYFNMVARTDLDSHLQEPA